MLRIVLRLFAVAVAIALAGAAGIALYLWQAFTSPGPSFADGASERIVKLDSGMGLSQIALRLQEEGVISNRHVFRAGVIATGHTKDLKAGEFTIPAGASMEQVMLILVEGKSILYKLTIAEGLTSAMVVRLIAADPNLIGDVPEVPPEGVILPETYLFPRGTTRQALLDQMIEAKRKLVEELWETRQPGLPFTTKEAAITLASIVEKETGVADERPRVAAVFVNRLRKGMRLQSDPTIIYGISKGEPLGRGIRKSELERATPYNTYIIDGLPPTPIANPGKAALEAVLNPPTTTELYFVADGTGGHAFADTLAEHERNVARWRKIERERQAGN